MRILSAAMALNAFISITAWAQSSPATGIQLSRPPEYRLELISVGNATYPAEAREKKIEGEVVAMFFVSESGDVSQAKVYKADPLLAAAVVAAVNKWKFKPVMRDDKPIPVVGKATFRFVLNDETQIADGVPGEIGAAIYVPRKIRVSSGVSQGLLLTKVSPIYPDEAKRKGIQGLVVLAATIDREGSIANLQLVSGPPELAPTAMETVKKWRYRPYLLMGIPVEVETQILVNFTLSR
jgi:protein TonB